MQFKGTGKENLTLVPLCWGSLFCVLLWWSTHHKKNVTTTIIKFTFMEYVLCDSALCNVLYNPLLNARRQMWLCPFYFFFFLILGEEAHTVQHEGSYFPEWELNPCPWQWKHRVLTTEPPGNSLDYAHFTWGNWISDQWKKTCLKFPRQ